MAIKKTKKSQKKSPKKIAVSHTDTASTVTTLLRDGRKYVPGFTVNPPDGRKLSGKYAIDPKYIESACAAVLASPRLRAACDFDPDFAREAIRFDAAFGAPEKEALAFVEGIRAARMLRYVQTIDAADQVLEVAKGLRRSPSETELAKHVGEMRDARKRKRKTAETLRAKPKTARAKSATPPTTKTTEKVTEKTVERS